MKYIFKQIDNISGRNAETTIEFSTDTLPDVLEHFEMFIRGCGFHPSGTLDFVEDELESESEEEHEWTETIRGESEWPFGITAKQRTVEVPLAESIYDDFDSPSGGSPVNAKMFITKPISDSSGVMDWTAANLIRPPKMKDKSVCPVCKIDNGVMLQHECWDKNCPKGQDAN